MPTTVTVQERLNGLGVEDVKFLFKEDMQLGKPASIVLSDVEDVLMRYLNGECQTVQAGFMERVVPPAV